MGNWKSSLDNDQLFRGLRILDQIFYGRTRLVHEGLRLDEGDLFLATILPLATRCVHFLVQREFIGVKGLGDRIQNDAAGVMARVLVFFSGISEAICDDVGHGHSIRENKE